VDLRAMPTLIVWSDRVRPALGPTRNARWGANARSARSITAVPAEATQF